MKFFLFLTSIVFTSYTYADSNNRALIEFKLASTQLSASFSAFLYFQGDKRNILRLHSARKKGDEALAKLTPSSAELSKRWNNIVYYLEKNSGHQFDDSDISLDVSWSLLQRELNEELEKTFLNESKELISSKKDLEVVSERVDSNVPFLAKSIDILNLQLKMESILSQYMTFSNATTGSYGSIRNEVPFEQQVENITNEMEALSENTNQFDSLKRNWKYIKKTLLAYNSNIAPYIVLHTFDKMRTDINEVLTTATEELVAVEE